MPRFMVTINRVYCERTTIELSADEIFVAVVPVLGRLNPGAVEGTELCPESVDGRLLRGHVTEVQKKVRQNDEFCPGDPSFVFSAETSDTLSLAMFLYERDDGRLRKELLEKFSASRWPVTIRDDPDLAKVWEDFLKKGIADLASISWGVGSILVKLLQGVVVVLPSLIKELRKDDLIAAREYTVALNDSETFLSREFEFIGKNGRARYEVSMTLSKAS